MTRSMLVTIVTLAVTLSTGCSGPQPLEGSVEERRRRLNSPTAGLKETFDHLRPSARQRSEGAFKTAFETIFLGFLGPYSFDDLGETFDLLKL